LLQYKNYNEFRNIKIGNNIDKYKAIINGKWSY
jgi:hypothetical protein